MCHIKHTQAKKFLPFNRWIMLGHIIFIKTLSVYVPNILSFLLIFHELFSGKFHPQDSDRCSWHSKILFNSQKFLVKKMTKTIFGGHSKMTSIKKWKFMECHRAFHLPLRHYTRTSLNYSHSQPNACPKKFLFPFTAIPPVSLSLSLSVSHINSTFSAELHTR